MMRAELMTLPRELTSKRIVFATVQPDFFEEHARLVPFLESEGAEIQREVTMATELVLTSKTTQTLKAVTLAETLNQRGASIRVVDTEEFVQFFRPSKNELVDLLKCGNRERIKTVVALFAKRNYVTAGKYWHWSEIELSGEDLRGAYLVGFPHGSWVLQEVDLSEAVIEDASVRIKNSVARNSTIKTTQQVWISATGCDFTGATLEINELWSITATSLCNKSSFENCNWEGARFLSSDLSGVRFQNCTFHDACFQDCLLRECTFADCSLKDVNLSGLDLSRSKLWDSDLSGCDFSKASLLESAVIGGSITGANFSNSLITGINIKKLDASQSRSLSSDARAIGPAEKAFQKMVTGSKEISVFFSICGTNGEISVELQRHYDPYILDLSMVSDKGAVLHKSRYTLPQALEVLKWKAGNDRLVIESIIVRLKRGTGESVSAKDATVVAMNALCEVFGVAVPDDRERKKLEASRKKNVIARTVERLSWLREGNEGRQKWNALTNYERQSLSLKKENLSGLDLTGYHLNDLDLSRVDLRGSTILDTSLDRTSLTKADLRGCTISGCTMHSTVAEEADFTDTVVKSCNLLYTSFDKANLANTQFLDVDFVSSKLDGADLSSVILTNARFHCTSYSAWTRVPKRYELLFLDREDFVWSGPGPDPATIRALRETAVEKLDFAKVLERLSKTIDKGRLDKALKMLKAETFQLFTRVSSEHVVGVVKSQTDPELVYSCLLTEEGRFCCATQNLRPCGGLQGALCKHLLVLVLGLTRLGELDANAAELWVRLSSVNTPSIDMEILSETFLQYEGVESGEIDWRPIETIPEDFYAY